MRITRLKKYGSLIRSDVRACPDVPCGGGAYDGICVVYDASCWGPGTSDHDCWDDKPCAGVGVSDFCNGNTGYDTQGCGGVFPKVDVAFNQLDDGDQYC